MRALLHHPHAIIHDVTKDETLQMVFSLFHARSAKTPDYISMALSHLQNTK